MPTMLECEYVANQLLLLLAYIDGLYAIDSHVAIDEDDTSCCLLTKELAMLEVYA